MRFLILVVALLAHAQEPNDTARLLSELIRVDTSNPPGQEGKLAALLAEKFRSLGFEINIIPTPEPGKAHFIARLRGDGSKRPILLAAHADVVGVEREKWTLTEAAVTPYLFQAGADASAWRNRDVPVYGIYPYPIDSEDLTRMHGNDERVIVDSLRSGTELIYRTLLAVAQRR